MRARTSAPGIARVVYLMVSVFALVAPTPCRSQSLALVAPPPGPAREAWVALEEARYREAEPLFQRALVRTPDNTTVLLGYGIVLRRLGRFDDADTVFTRALRIDPALTAASQLLGMMLHEQGNVTRAIQVYEAALVRAPGHPQLTLHLGRWRQEAELHAGFLREEGSHFTVMFEGPASQAAATAAVDILEQAYGRIGDALLTYPAGPIQVVLYTREQFRDVTRSPAWAGGVYDGRIRIPVGGERLDTREFQRVLSHEFVHAVVHSVAPTGVPAWMGEGLAVLLEREGGSLPQKPGARAKTLQLSEVTRSFGTLPPGEVGTAYQDSGSAVRFIVDRVGYHGLMALVADLGAGEEFERAFQNRVFMPFSDFEREWREQR
jgi:tetratricopeptide (TPR) repeat protein